MLLYHSMRLEVVMKIIPFMHTELLMIGKIQQLLGIINQDTIIQMVH